VDTLSVKDEAWCARLGLRITGTNSDAIIYVLDPSCYKLGRILANVLYVASQSESWLLTFGRKVHPARERKLFDMTTVMALTQSK
jgi:hypothetical protein